MINAIDVFELDMKKIHYEAQRRHLNRKAILQ